LGGIIFGVMTPTEAAVVAVVYAFVISLFVYKEMKLRDIPDIITTAMKSTASVMFVVGGATAAAYLITTAHIAEMLSDTLTAYASNASVLLLLINILLLIVGCVMDTAPAILILTPVLMPVITRFGIDPVHFGVVMVMNLCIGLLTPPVGAVLYVGSGLTNLSIYQLTRGMLPFIAVMTVVLFLITYVPDLVLITTRLVR
jgi:tripartite ATP-independent transporter DctM subunit